MMFEPGDRVIKVRGRWNIGLEAVVVKMSDIPEEELKVIHRRMTQANKVADDKVTYMLITKPSPKNEHHFTAGMYLASTVPEGFELRKPAMEEIAVSDNSLEGP